MSTTSRPESGFTLIELVVALAIIGLILGLVLPLLGRRAPGTALAVAASEIRSVLSEARITAIAEDRPVAFAGDPLGGYRLDGRRYRLAGGEPEAAVRVAVAGGRSIAFFPSGGSSGGRIILAAGDARRALTVDALTGRAAPLR